MEQLNLDDLDSLHYDLALVDATPFLPMIIDKTKG